MFEQYSEGSRRIIFLSRKIAGQRGAAEIGVEDLVEGLVAEDQGEFGRSFLSEAPPGAPVPVMPKHQSYFTAETAAAIRRGLEPLLSPAGKPLPTSLDMPLNKELKRVLERAKELSEQRYEPASPTHMHYGRLEPLHLLAAVLEDEKSPVAAVLRKAGVAREDVIRAIQKGEPA